MPLLSAAGTTGAEEGEATQTTLSADSLVKHCDLLSASLKKAQEDLASLYAVLKSSSQITAGQAGDTQQNKTDNPSTKNSRLIQAAYSLGALVVVLLIALFFLNKTKGNKIYSLNDEKEEYKSKLEKSEAEKTRLLNEKNSQKTTWEQEKRELQERIISLQKEGGRKRNEEADSPGSPIPTSPVPPAPPAPPAKVSLYADSIYGGAFNRVTEQPNDDTIFELIKSPDSRTAEFIVWENVHTKVLKRPEFVDGCDTQMIGNQRLEVEHGTAQLEEGKWVIMEKAKIKFA